MDDDVNYLADLIQDRYAIFKNKIYQMAEWYVLSARTTAEDEAVKYANIYSKVKKRLSRVALK